MKKAFKAFLSICLLMGSGFILQAQEDEPLSRFVRRIFQDQSGNLWFGTNGDGVIRADGDSLEYFSINEGFGGVAVRGIVEDKKGNVWFGTERGLTKYDGKSFTNFTKTDGLVDNDVWSIAVDSKGTIWIGTLQGVSRFDGKVFTPFELPESKPDPTRGVTSAAIVHSIMEDSKGRMWFGTNGGAYIYDGKKLSNLSEKDGLSNNGVNCILEDKAGNYWFATHHKGVCRWDGTSFNQITTEHGVNGTEAWDIYEDRSGNIWFPIENSGVYRYDGKSFTNFQKEQGLTTNAIQCTFEDKEGRLWLGGWQGLFRYDASASFRPNGKSIFSVGKDGPWQQHNRTDPPKESTDKSKVSLTDEVDSSFSASKTTSTSHGPRSITRNAWQNRKGNIWFRSLNGVGRNDGKSEIYFEDSWVKDSTPPAFSATQFEKTIRPLLVKFCADCHESGDYFLAAKTTTDVVGLRDVYASVVEQLENRGMPPKDSDQPTDAERKLITEWLKKTLDFKPGYFDRIAPYVVETYEDKKGNLWFGTMHQGAARYDGKTLTWFSKKDGLPSNAVPSFAEDKDGNLWVGTQEGICRFDGKTFVQLGSEEGLPAGDGRVRADRDGNIWAGMNTGVFRFDGSSFSEFKLPIDKDKISSYAIIPGQVSMALEDRSGNLWFSTDGVGAYKFDGKSFTHFTSENGLCSNNVTSILEDEKGNIWFTCMQSYQPEMSGDGGVCRYDGKTFTRFPKVKGLSENDIYTIYETKTGNIWIGATHVGAYRYDGETFTLFSETDRKHWTRNFGVQGIVEDKNGTLWFGFSGGLFRFNGESFINVTKDGLCGPQR